MSKHTKKTILVALLTMTVALAGCVSDDEPTAGADGGDTEVDETIELGNKGAISGLVVDDNFRPVQLKEEWDSEPGDFQDVGFVLILETGQRFETNENGEFKVLPVDPGSYTLRVAADTHEAKDTTVQVVAGEFAEVTVEARRQYSGGGTILSQEQVLFMACYGNFYFFSIALASVEDNGCGDLSGDSSRFDFMTDQPELQPDVRGLVTEMRASQEWRYSVTIRLVEEGGEQPNGDPACNPYCEFADADVTDGTYIHNVLYPGLMSTGTTGEYLEDGQEGYCKVGREPSTCPFYAFTMEFPFQTALFTAHPTEDYVQPTCAPLDPVREIKEEYVGGFPPTGCGGVGIALGIKAQFLQNIFLYELPEEGIDDYCALCEDADIPE